MLSLEKGLVTSIDIGGYELELNMAYDNIIRINAIQNDLSLTDAEQLTMGAELLFVNPPRLNEQQIQKLFIYVYGEVLGQSDDDNIEYDLLGNPMPKRPSEDDEDDDLSGPDYDFEQDFDYIYSSFMMDYGIDLLREKGKMHWYVFRSLLMGLSDRTMFERVISIRRAKLPKKGAERAQMEKLKRKFALKPRGRAVQDEGD